MIEQVKPKGGGTRRARGVSRIARAMVVLAAALIPHRSGLAAPGGEAATVVSMNLRDVPASEAYAELARIAGVAFTFTPKPLSGDPKTEPRLTARLIQEPFWTAVDQLNRQSGFVVQDISRQPAPRVTLRRPNKPGTFGELQTCVAGAFLGTVLDRTAFTSRAATRQQQQHPGRRELGVQLHAEPKLRPLFWHSMRVDELVDDAGRRIPHVVLLNPGAPRMVPFYAGPAYFALRVDGPADTPLRVSRFSVTGQVMAGLRFEVAEVTGLNGDAPLSGYAGGFSVDAEKTTTARGRLLHVTLTRTADDGPAWLRPASRMYVLDPVVLDDKGRRVHAPPIEFRAAGRACHILLKLDLPSPPSGAATDPPGEPHRLLLDIPTDVTEYDVRLDFTDLTLK